MTHRVGRVRIKLAKIIEKTFYDDGIEVRCDPADLVPTQGYWRTDIRADVMPWEGRIMVNTPNVGWRSYSIDSWDTMTECLRGFEWEQLYPMNFHIHAKEPPKL